MRYDIQNFLFEARNFKFSTMAAPKHSYANRLKGSEKNVWVEFTKLASEPGVLNLGQGFPDFQAPEHVVKSLQKAIGSGNKFVHQYTRPFGHPRLIKALSEVYSPLLKRPVDPMTEVLVSVGAYGSLFCIIQGMVNPGDEVIIIEPYFDCYEPMVRTAGGIPVFVPLRPSKHGVKMSSADWKLDPKELESKFSDKTKLIVVNTPNNPLGKVFVQSELEMVAELCKKYDVVCVADEVYEWMTYPGIEHIKIATLPGMWDRTITVGSAGKTFSVTGWKLGWSVAPENLLMGAKLVHQNSVYTCPTPIQEAVAEGLELEIDRRDSVDCYFKSLALELLPKRDELAQVLEGLGMHPVVPEGGYFMLADISQMKVDLSDYNKDEPKDFKFAKWMIKEKKLAGIPPSAFYCSEHKQMGENYIRFCFIKEDETLKSAEDILRKWKQESS
ncbi:kynurenine--oxoglutarate transaminase 3-like isoform X2 [Littorina saxatilis]|uniref:kynurenine--oxoglutarate transaminase 3-like isoform X2 n=1 Tax=Littorina saxatilis TaxID=31220 RepID=UPI0038B421B5